MNAKIWISALVLFVGSCAGQEQALQKSPSFRAGYEDGCAAATNAGTDLRERPTEDAQSYAGDPAYRTGYGNGLSTCRRNDLQPMTAPGAGPITLPGPGH